MVMLIPAICLNPKCRSGFFSGGIADFPEGGTVHFDTTRIGPCPKCGNLGLVPSGTYTNLGPITHFKPLSHADQILFENVAEFARKASSGTSDPEQVKKDALQKFPQLQALWDLLPQDKDSMRQFLVFLGLLLTSFIPGESNDKRPLIPAINVNQNVQISAPDEMRTAIEDYLKSSPTSDKKKYRKDRQKQLENATKSSHKEGANEGGGKKRKGRKQ